MNFSHNFLRALAFNGTCYLIKFQMLDVSHNNFTEIPEPITYNFYTLLYLNMSRNRISKIIPDAFIGLSNYLLELDLSFNRLTVFPESIKSLLKLEKLNMAGNLILTVPDAGFSLWPSLSVFQFHGNPLVCSCSTAWLRNYTLTTDLGQCSYPVELKGNVATCLATSPCDSDENVYSSKENIQACKNGLVLTHENQHLKWDLPSGNVQTTSQTQANVEVFKKCKLVTNFSLVVDKTLKLSGDVNEIVCVTLSDRSWISNLTECFVLGTTEDGPEVSTEYVPLQEETTPPNTVYIGVIVALSVTLAIVVCTVLIVFLIRKCQAVEKPKGNNMYSMSIRENKAYESKTDYGSPASNVTSQEDYYDEIQPSYVNMSET
ncbi:leucine-rich repeat-containing protein 4-like [Pecten maximus]|uniref:leucine-rich repeat-containing protein 4-like n=1 Tax=Pecten maximus TaxID=6579 RepID=UPI00145809A3|nr:leucine-rich repeat-containing protein 4-like [Pecten maximus]